MTRLALVDDDHSSELLAESLRYRGYEVERFRSAQAAVESLERIASADLVILDMVMERLSGDLQVSISGDRATGMEILRRIRGISNAVPVLVFSATTDSEIVQALEHSPGVTFLSKWNCSSPKEFVESVARASGVAGAPPSTQCFIVHGQDEVRKLELKNFLQNSLGFSEPVILHEQPNLGRTIIEKFEAYASVSDLVFVLLTPDDKVAGADDSNDEKRRARQNVIFELGYFLGILGRTTGRVILLHMGGLELPSDISGVVYINISHGIAAAGEELRKELLHVLK